MTEKYVTTEEFEKYKKGIEKKIKRESGPPRPPREPNAYNLYMKDKIAELKKTDPTITNKEAFIKGASAWNDDKKKVVAKDVKEVKEVK